MNDILNKATVLVLNRNWQAINIRTPQDAFCQMATGVATGASWVCCFRALQIGEASKVAPVDKLSLGGVLVLALKRQGVGVLLSPR